MAAETFTQCVHSQSSETTDYATLNRKFGDGYEQVAENGLNNVAQSWSIFISGTDTKIREIRNFLDRHAGIKSFLRMPPLGEFGFYRETAPSISGGEGNYYIPIAAFTQAYHP